MQSGEEFDYNDRYGVRPQKRWVTPAIALAVIGLGWSIWAGLHHANPAIRYELISFNVIAEREISIRYTVVRTDPMQVVICTLTASDQDKNVVGQIDEKIAAGTSQIEQTTVIPARTAPVSAASARCRAE